MELRPLGRTGIDVSPLGLGTVKIGRNEQVKYPQSFDLPDDRSVQALLALARDLGINLIDTAPAYGVAQARLGALLPRPRRDWVIVSKVGERFEHGASRFDFTFAATIRTVEDSLRTLGTDYLDCVLIHSDGDDLRILREEGAVDALEALKRRGLILSHGMSSKTLEGGLAVVDRLDVVMATCNLGYNDERPVLEAAERTGKGVLIKKGLSSGHLAGPGAVEEAFRFIYGQPGVSSIIVGTINSAHLRANVAAAEAALGRP
jgi:aryl-alcohol dehydrogenase-like predicted oxidoreductase